MKANEVSVSGERLWEVVCKHAAKEGSIKDVAEELGLPVGKINSRLIQLRKNNRAMLEALNTPKEVVDEIIDASYFPKGKKVGKGAAVGRMTKEQLQKLLTMREQVIADAVGADAETVQENGMSLVRKSDLSKEDHDAVIDEVEKQTAL